MTFVDCRTRPGWLARAVVVLLIVYLGIAILFATLENSLVYFPSRYPDGEWSLESEPQVEDAWFTAADRTKLHGWFLACEKPRAVTLFLHGNGGNIAGRRDMLDWFRRLNLAVLMFDYRGYGRSEGAPNEQGVLDDARAARAWLAERSGVAQSQIVLWGESLGGGAAVDLATDGARGLVLESTFTSIPDVAAYHYPWFPSHWLMRNRFNSLAKIARYHGPLLQTHGDADTIVPYALGHKLFDVANEPKTFVTISGGDHNDPRSREFFRALDEFFDRIAEASPGNSASNW